MRHFVVDDLPPADRDAVRKFYFRMGAGYALAILLGVLSIFVRSPTPRLAREVAALCAERDLKLVGLLNEHGEAQDVSADDLRNAFIALVNARKVCFSGHIKEALAIYDGVGFSGGKTAKYFRPSK